MNHYDLLGINRKATAEEICKAYRKLAAQYHPDTTTHDVKTATAKFREITEAYEVLTTQRKQYDARLYAPPRPKVDPNVGVYTPPPPEFDLWGRRLTAEEKRQWVIDNGTMYPTWPLPDQSKPKPPKKRNESAEHHYFRDSVRKYETDEVKDIR